MDQKLLPPVDHPTAIVEISPEKTHGYFAPPTTTRLYAAPLHDRPFCRQSSPDRSGVCRTIAVCIIALAVCAGFSLLYIRMTELEQEVKLLQDLTDASFDGKPHWEDDGSWAGQTGSRDGDDFKTDDDHVILGEGETKTRERRSAGDGARHQLSKRHVATNGEYITNQLSAHVLPLLRGVNAPDVEERIFSLSEWFEWTDVGQFAHSQFSVEDNKFLVVPFTGYYFIYSQVTVSPIATQIAVGHKISIKGGCGRDDSLELTHSMITPSNSVTSDTVQDSTYTAGVFFLRQYDHIGVKPNLSGANVGAGFLRNKKNGYFGAILLTRQQDSSPCHYYPS